MLIRGLIKWRATTAFAIAGLGMVSSFVPNAVGGTTSTTSNILTGLALYNRCY